MGANYKRILMRPLFDARASRGIGLQRRNFRRHVPFQESMMRSNRLSFFGIFAVLIAVLVVASAIGGFRHSSNKVEAAPPAAGPSGYHLLKTIKVGGEGFWDYLNFDSPTRRLFISRGTKVVVLDVDSEKVVGEIPN